MYRRKRPPRWESPFDPHRICRSPAGRSFSQVRPPTVGCGSTLCGNAVRGSPPPLSSLLQQRRGRYVGILKKDISDAAMVLPFQGILENFVHQNPLSNFEDMPFVDAVEHAHELEQYMSPGHRCFALCGVDPRRRVHEAVAELCAVFLDRGAAKWSPQERSRGFLYLFASLEGLGFAPWRAHARKVAKSLLAEYAQDPTEDAVRPRAKKLLAENLTFFGVDEKDWTDALRACMLEQRGWSSMFHRMESQPVEMPPNTPVRLVEYLAVLTTLLRSSVRSLATGQGFRTSSEVTEWLKTAPTKRETSDEHAHHVSAIASADQEFDHRESLEVKFKHTLLEAIGTREIPKPSTARPKLQVWACIDDRMESFRRHIESANPEGIETFGVAGFFGVPLRYQPLDGRDEMIQAPFGQQPKLVLSERPSGTCLEAAPLWKQRRRFLARVIVAVEKMSFSPIFSVGLGGLMAPIAIARLWLMSFAPLWMRRSYDRLLQTYLPPVRTTFDLPMSPAEAARMLNQTFREIGTTSRFAPLVLIVGHGNTSTNNPFAAAYNCGACQGHDGAPNARMVAKMANHPEVRKALSQDYRVDVPIDTHFVAADINTCTDEVEYFDLDDLPASHVERLEQVRAIVDRARGKNALERCYRFLLARPASASEALDHVKRRAVDYSEVRPELNHATNAAVVVGRRDLTKSRFLDRRVFLPSYDPFSDDERGTHLERVLTPSLVVCSGINLEYLFSTADVDGHGAGTKVPLNIVGNIGVLQGVSGDLHPGLPSQMTEMHTPIRAHYVIDAPVARVEAVLDRNQRLRNLVKNEWVRVFVRDPFLNAFFKYTKGEYVPVESNTTETTISFEPQRHHGSKVAAFEQYTYHAAALSMVACCAGPILYHYGLVAADAAGHALADVAADAATTAAAADVHHNHSLQPWAFSAVWPALLSNPRGALIAVGATALSLPTLAFARRYLHGEEMFGRFSILCVGLLLGFNMVATSPDLHLALGGWTLFGFSSAFLIGTYNERPSVRNNAIFAFAAYKLGDLAMLLAAAASSSGSGPTAVAVLAPTTLAVSTGSLAAAGLLLASFFKSSQFPLSVLFARSMEGPTPSSALGYAGLSAHIGIVLLAGTMPIWFPHDWARIVVAVGGCFTAVASSLVARIRSDRKGAIAYATSASLGILFTLLSLGYRDLVLVLSLGHAGLRMIQVLRAPNSIADNQFLRAAMGDGRPLWGSTPPKWLYHLAWRLRRFDTDFHLLNVVHWVLKDEATLAKTSNGSGAQHKNFSKATQFALVTVIVILAGFPFTPLTHWKEEALVAVAKDNCLYGAGLAALDFFVSVALMNFVFVRVLRRVKH